jgi:hypothetical protein
MKNLEDIYLKNKAFENIIIEKFSFTNNFIYLSVVKFYNILKGKKKKKLKFHVHVSCIIRWQKLYPSNARSDFPSVFVGFFWVILYISYDQHDLVAS